MLQVDFRRWVPLEGETADGVVLLAAIAVTSHRVLLAEPYIYNQTEGQNPILSRHRNW